jgi:disulfide bond formation protein DsbB
MLNKIMEIVADILAYGTFALNIGFLIALSAYLYNRFSEEGLNRFDSYSILTGFIRKYALELAFIQASVATAGSLYMSNILQWAPCRLCWFQRIFMYPLVILLGVSLLFNSRDVKDYVIPTVLVGIPIALYHFITQRVSQFQSAGCSITQVSCSTEYTFHFGYITIPTMALTAFITILVLVWIFYRE